VSLLSESNYHLLVSACFYPAMMASLSLYRSPKRKRDTSESECHSPSASPPSTGSINSPREARIREEDVGRYSPRNTVVSRFKKLDIHEDQTSDSRYRSDPLHRDAKNAPQTDSKEPFTDDIDMHSALLIRDSPSPSEDHGEFNKQQGKQQSTSYTASRRTEKTGSPRKKRNPPQLSGPRSRRRSPPLSVDVTEDPLTWHDSEITGHNPNDPNDDGYGINGIGFKPTPAIAWARSQKRQKQVADWKDREAREARERRRERREGINRDRIYDAAEGTIQKRVKFNVDD
jgi:hypothetical protein